MRITRERIRHFGCFLSKVNLSSAFPSLGIANMGQSAGACLCDILLMNLYEIAVSWTIGIFRDKTA